VLEATEPGRYLVPAGDGAGPPVIIDFASVEAARGRLEEVASVNSHKAPELLAFYNKSWGKLWKLSSLLVYQRNLADKALADAKAEALLAVTDAVAEARGFRRATQEIRKAIADRSPEVHAATERLEEIRFVLNHVQGLAKEFENAYTSVKKIVGSSSPSPVPPSSFGGPREPGAWRTRPQGRAVDTEDSGEMPGGMEEG
jgi:hypothetical protein